MKNTVNSRSNPAPMPTRARARKSTIAYVWRRALAGTVFALTPVYAHAQSAPPLLTKALPSDGSLSPGPVTVFTPWLDMVSATQAAQPHWMTPLVTVTPRLEQEFRWDFYDQQNASAQNGQANGQHILNYGGPGGPRIEFIPAYNVEVIVAPPPYETVSGPRGSAEGPGDWPMFLAKYRFISANEQNGNYIVTGFFQMSDPSGTAGRISNNILVAQPTLAFGKGWGDFDIQMTISQQYPVSAITANGSTASMNYASFGEPILWNTTFQYHFMEYFWPEFEVNYTYYLNGEHSGLSQVLLTPGIILGRFKIGMDSPTRPINLIIGAGYQFAVTPTPVVQNNVVATVRVTF
jgi:hypothetical protein